jgi:hypothetical protein
MQPYDRWEENAETAAYVSQTQRSPVTPVRLQPFPTDRPPFDRNEGNERPGTADSMQAPRTAPPQYIPQRTMDVRAVDPGSIRNCLRRFTYIWLDNGVEFWMFPVFLGRQSVSGFRWNRRFGWSYFGISLNRIDAFTCR